MAGFGEALLKGLTDKATMGAMEEAISSYVREMAATLASRDPKKPTSENSFTNPPSQD
jgi:hypothetical protein